MNVVEDPKLLKEARCYEIKEIGHLTHCKVLSDEEYAKYFALLLYKNDLCAASGLWERIPDATKSRCSDINQLWKTCCKMCKRDHSGTLLTLKEHKWSPPLKEYIANVVDITKLRFLRIFKCGFTVIDYTRFLTTLDYTDRQAKKKIKELGWTLIGDKVYPGTHPPLVKISKNTPTKSKEKQKKAAPKKEETVECIYPDPLPEIPAYMRASLGLPPIEDEIIVISDSD